MTDTTTFRRIRMRGNRPAHVFTATSVRFLPPDLDQDNIVTCADGFRFSVIAGANVYSLPRVNGLPDFPDTMTRSMGMTSAGYPGPYTHVECGFFNGKLPKPAKLWRFYSDYGHRSTYRHRIDVYAYVPVRLVYALIRRHGGEVPTKVPMWTDIRQAAADRRIAVLLKRSAAALQSAIDRDLSDIANLPEGYDVAGGIVIGDAVEAVPGPGDIDVCPVIEDQGTLG